MTLSNKNAIKTYGVTNYIGGNMGQSGYFQNIGKAFVFNVDGYEVIKHVFYTGEERFEISGKNILEYISMDVLDMSLVEAINESLRVELSIIIIKIPAARPHYSKDFC